MKNTVLVESKIRQKLKLACTALCIFCIMFVAFLVCVVMIDKQNLNGQVTEVTSILTKVYETDSNVLTMQDGKEYNVVWSDNIDIDFNDYKNTTVTLIVTQKTFANSNPWILGLKVNDEIIVDYKETLNSKITANNEVKTVVITITVVLCVVTCGAYIWRFNTQPLVERELYHEFAEFLSQRQPPCPQRKKLQIGIYVYLGIVLFMMILLSSFGAASDAEDNLIVIIIGAISAGVTLIGAIALIIATAKVFRKEIDFYSDRMPFDLSDISHAPMRKKIKEELQKEITNDRELHPHLYADGGNGYDVQFNEKGVTLTVPSQSASLPKAEEVFDCDEVNISIDDNTSYSNVFTKQFTYDQLNFEAVAHYRRHSRPMMIIIKSRLTRSDDFPDEFVNDIHIPFDLNLFYTLTTFNVDVENLNYLMNNRKKLMLENCLKSNKKSK